MGEGAGERGAQEVEHLFRREWGRMVAALVRVVGVHNLPLAEDVAQDVLSRAVEIWKLRGIPEKPRAWLMAAARNRALDLLRRERRARAFAPELARFLESEWTLAPRVRELFLDGEIEDGVLRMMFSCCQADIPESAQVALILHILGGFSVREVASAFLEGEAAVDKRIQRAKRSLGASGGLFDVAGGEAVRARLGSVLRALYLLFSEGYHGSNADRAVRTELCEEATRLCALLADHEATGLPEVFALLALMCLDAARLPGRVDEAGDLQPLADQDRSRWDRRLIERGAAFLSEAASGEEVSAYHVEAAIAAEHALAASAERTDWRRIAELYDMLLLLRPGPVVALNRAIAMGMAEGPDRGIEALEAIADRERFDAYPFYEAALGEMHRRAGRPEQASAHTRSALERARSEAERRFLTRRLGENGGASL